MTDLTALIIDKIRQAGGKIPFSTYMDMALYAPEGGYYTGYSHQLGRQGDFITAPELSPLFGQCIGHAIQPVLTALNQPVVLEFGGGTGKLAKTLLDYCPAIERYWMIEISPALKAQQQKTLEKYLSKITWLDKLPAEKFEGVILANEVIDAFPATRFCLQDNTIYEYYVSENNGILGLCLAQPSCAEITRFVESLQLASPYASEMHLSLKPWIKSLSECLAAGVILCMDYGFPRHEFYHPDRYEGTLMCHYQQRAHTDAFYLPGLQDITAHVDFTAVAEGAAAANLAVAGYTSQAAFLLDSGITDLARTAEDNNAIKMLTLPSEMGELFKVIALSRQWDLPLRGFNLQDWRGRLS